MRLWKAEYHLKCLSTNEEKTMEYLVAAATAGDVPEVIRKECNFDDVSVEYVSIQVCRTPLVLTTKELK